MKASYDHTDGGGVEDLDVKEPGLESPQAPSIYTTNGHRVTGGYSQH